MTLRGQNPVSFKGALPPCTPAGALPLDPTGALRRAPGPHADLLEHFSVV